MINEQIINKHMILERNQVEFFSCDMIFERYMPSKTNMKICKYASHIYIYVTKKGLPKCYWEEVIKCYVKILQPNILRYHFIQLIIFLSHLYRVSQKKVYTCIMAYHFHMEASDMDLND